MLKRYVLFLLLGASWVWWKIDSCLWRHPSHVSKAVPRSDKFSSYQNDVAETAGNLSSTKSVSQDKLWANKCHFVRHLNCASRAICRPNLVLWCSDCSHINAPATRHIAARQRATLENHWIQSFNCSIKIALSLSMAAASQIRCNWFNSVSLLVTTLQHTTTRTNYTTRSSFALHNRYNKQHCMLMLQHCIRFVIVFLKYLPLITHTHTHTPWYKKVLQSSHYCLSTLQSKL